MKDPRDISKRDTKVIKIDLLAEPNNCFTKEMCIFGHMFDADSTTIYELAGFGYVCYKCANKLMSKKKK